MFNLHYFLPNLHRSIKGAAATKLSTIDYTRALQQARRLRNQRMREFFANVDRSDDTHE
jgi:hypothetical protein